MPSHCGTQELLKKAGIEENTNRTLVLDILTRTHEAVSPKAILDELRKSVAFDKVTLYRILDLLVTKKILRRIAGLNGSMLYEVVCPTHHPLHAHFVCTTCGRMECLENPPINDLIKKIKKHRKTADEDVDLRFEGICKACKPSKGRNQT